MPRLLLASVPLLAALTFVPTLTGCSSDAETPAATCPAGSASVDGRCAKVCTIQADCRLTESCIEGLCASPATDVVDIVRFAVSSPRVARGATVRIGYAVTNAVRVQITTTDQSGNVTPVIDTTERFSGIVETDPLRSSVTISLNAFNADNQIKAEVLNVEVVDDGQVSIASFSANPPLVLPGAVTTLSWRVVNGIRTVRIVDLETEDEIFSGPLVGSHRTPVAQTTTFLLAAEGRDGTIAEAQTTVIVNDAGGLAITDVALSPGPVRAGDSALLTWNTVGAEWVEIRANRQAGQLLYRSTERSFVADGRFLVFPEQSPQTAFFVVAGTGDEVVFASEVVDVEFTPSPPFVLSFTVTPPFLENEVPEVVTFEWNVLPNSAEVVLLLDGLPVSMGNAYSDVFFPGPAVIADLEAVTETGVARRRARLWTARPEQEPNDSTDLAGATDGFAMAGILASTASTDEDWFTVSVPPDGLVKAEFLAPNRNCPSSLDLELWKAGTLIKSASSLLGQCPDFVAPNLPGGEYFVRVNGPRVGVAFPYLLAIASDPAECGDGFLAERALEKCDDGNLIAGDGCDAQCQTEPAYLYTANQVATELPEVPPSAVPLRWLPYDEAQALPASDEGFSVVPLPFQFRFFGRHYEGVVVHTNGFVSLQGDLAGPEVDPRRPWGQGRPNAVIAALAADLDWTDRGSPRGWVGQDPLLGAVVWIDFDGGAIKGESASVGPFRVGLTSTDRVVLIYGDVRAQSVFFAGIEDHSGEFRYPHPKCDGDNGCGLDALPSNTVTVFRNTSN